jgi:uncharacterized protein YqgV (UPF0045/DUF77 family)
MMPWLSVTPDDGYGSYSQNVAAALRIVQESGLRFRLGAMGTELEGSRGEVFAVLARCQEALAAAPGSAADRNRDQDRRPHRG